MIFEHQITFELEDGTRYNTWKDWHLVPTERPYVVPPALKAHYTNIDASNGTIDQTTALTEYPVFDDRSNSWTFYVINNGVEINTYHGEWFDRYSKIANTIHGQKVKVYLDDQPDYYYTGRVTINNWSNGNTWSQIQIGYQLYPYKLSVEDYDTGIQNVSGTTAIKVVGSEMPISPKITVTSREYIFNPNQPATRAMIVQMCYKYWWRGTDEPEVTNTIPFIDVPSNAYYLKALKWMYLENLNTTPKKERFIAGYTNELFVPNNVCTRGQFFQIIWRMNGSPKVTTSIPFTDVKSTDYYYDAVKWAFNRGFTSGTSATTFSPNQAITRAQAVHVLWKMAGSPTVSLPVGEDVKDVADSTNNKPWYYDAVKWSWTHHYMAGTTSTKFDPAVASTRGHFFTVLYSWYCGHQLNKPFNGEWASTLGAWKKSKHQEIGYYTEPTNIGAFQNALSNSGQSFSDAEITNMWNNTQNWIYRVRPRTNMTASELAASDEYCKFTDIKVTDYYYYPALFADIKGFTAGIDTQTFGATLPIQRWQCVYILWIVAGRHDPIRGGYAVDVGEEVYWRNAVDWCIENGITTLNADKTFDPNGHATRAMVAQFFYKLEQWWGGTDSSLRDVTISDGTMPFTDIPDGNLYYTKAVDWALVNGIAAKYGAGLKIKRTGRKDLQLVDGENRLPQIVVKPGQNEITFEGQGTARIEYKRGSL